MYYIYESSNLGIQLIAREYDFNGLDSATFTRGNILGIVPVVKSVVDDCEAGSLALTRGILCMQKGELGYVWNDTFCFWQYTCINRISGYAILCWSGGKVLSGAYNFNLYWYYFVDILSQVFGLMSEKVAECKGFLAKVLAQQGRFNDAIDVQVWDYRWYINCSDIIAMIW